MPLSITVPHQLLPDFKMNLLTEFVFVWDILCHRLILCYTFLYRLYEINPQHNTASSRLCLASFIKRASFESTLCVSSLLRTNTNVTTDKNNVTSTFSGGTRVKATFSTTASVFSHRRLEVYGENKRRSWSKRKKQKYKKSNKEIQLICWLEVWESSFSHAGNRRWKIRMFFEDADQMRKLLNKGQNWKAHSCVHVT